MTTSAGVTFSVDTITPDDAAHLLGRFYAKGKVDQRLLQSYMREIEEGRWILNGAPIVLSEAGDVLDGRIRLLACVQSRTAFASLVVRGISSSSYETIDAVRKRTLGDVLAIRHERHGRALASGLRIISAYMKGVPPGSGKAPSPTELLALLEQNPTIRDSILPAMAAMPLLPHGCGIALHYLMGRVNPSRADRFLALIGEPTGAEETSAVLHLRQVLMELKGKGGSRKQSYILAVAIKAWNAFQTGANLKLLRFSPERESFPRISGLNSSHGPLFDAAHKPSELNISALSHGNIKARITTITPAMAEVMLEANDLNRHVSASVINKYARDMAAGCWKLNGQTIKISATGRLLDGQHRLEAVKKAKNPFVSIVVEGLDDNSFVSLDVGRRRSVSELLRERGESHTITLASSLRWLWMIRNEVILAANSSPTNSEILQLLEDNPSIRDSLRHVIQIREIMGSGIAAALHFSFSQYDTNKSNEFFSRLIDGVQLAETSPIYQLRERLIRTRSSHRIRLAEAERVALTIKAWNAFRQDRPVQLLAWRNRGAMREALPVPI